jgi:hypothetical protein
MKQQRDYEEKYGVEFQRDEAGNTRYRYRHLYKAECVALAGKCVNSLLYSPRASVVDPNSFFSDSDPQIFFFGYGFGFLD